MHTLQIQIPIPPVTKKNSQRIVSTKRADGSVSNRILPSRKFIEYQEEAGFYIPDRSRIHLDVPCEVSCYFYMPNRRTVDLTNLLEAIDDVLVAYGVLADDNSKIIFSHDGSRVLYCKEFPRTEVTIKWND